MEGDKPCKLRGEDPLFRPKHSEFWVLGNDHTHRKMDILNDTVNRFKITYNAYMTHA